MRTVGDLLHSGKHIVYLLPAFYRCLRGHSRQFTGFTRIIGVTFHVLGNLLHISRGLHQRCRLLFGTLRQIAIPLRDFTGRQRNGLAAVINAVHDTGQFAVHKTDRRQQAPGILLTNGDICGQVTGCDLLHDRDRIGGFAPELAGKIAGNNQRDGPGSKQCQQQQATQQIQRLLITRLRFCARAFTVCNLHIHQRGEIFHQLRPVFSRHGAADFRRLFAIAAINGLNHFGIDVNKVLKVINNGGKKLTHFGRCIHRRFCKLLLCIEENRLVLQQLAAVLFALFRGNRGDILQLLQAHFR